MRIWVDGRWEGRADGSSVDPSPRTMPPGEGLFETVKVVDGVPFALTRHVRRLAAAADRLGLPPVPVEQVRAALATAEEVRGLARGRVRISWTADVTGRGGVSAQEGAQEGAQGGVLGLVTGPVGPPAETALETAVVRTVPWRRNERGALAGVKATAYADNVAALALARSQGADEALFLDTRGRLCEGTMTNLFYVVGGQLRTPALSTGCLPGVTRELVRAWSGAVEVEETAEVVAHVEEAFLTSTLRDVQPVREWDGRLLPAPGPVTSRVRREWSERVALTADP